MAGQVYQAKSWFDFQGLPPEVQNLVYHHAFVKKGSYIGSSKQGRMTNTVGFRNEARRYRNMNFIKSCRKVYNEASQIFYAENGFEFCNINILAEFLEAIGAAHRALITKLRVHYSSSVSPYVAFRKLRYLLSCLAVHSLELNARFMPVKHPGLWCSFPVMNAHGIFFGMEKEVFFGGIEVSKGTCNLQEVQENIVNQEIWSKIRESLQVALDRICKQREGVCSWVGVPHLFDGRSRQWGKGGDTSALLRVVRSSDRNAASGYQSQVLSPSYDRLINWPWMSDYPLQESRNSDYQRYKTAFTLRSKVLGRDPLLYADLQRLVQYSGPPASIASLLQMEAGPEHTLPHDLYKSDQYYASVVSYLTAHWAGDLPGHASCVILHTTHEPSRLVNTPAVRTRTPSHTHIGLLGNHRCSPVFCEVIKHFKHQLPRASPARVLRLAVREYDQMMKEKVVQPARNVSGTSNKDRGTD